MADQVDTSLWDIPGQYPGPDTSLWDIPGQYPFGGGPFSNRILGSGMLSAGDSLADVDGALRGVQSGQWVKLLLGSPGGWKAGQILAAAEVVRVDDTHLAWQWLYDGNGLATGSGGFSRKDVLAQIVRQSKGGIVTWELSTIAMPWTGTGAVSTSAPFGLELPKPDWKAPEFKLPEFKLDLPRLPDLKTVGALALGAVLLAILFKD